ncbi:speckle-type POZ protein B-like [Nasonia vitripennis]|uniref:BTB domain-containing protein n=1 Tax=Nasonia vitripennis TaxID=7425 RepID=A0A7M7H7Z8_NASVI|nr:speckle-type POZ protein B-like [Nasonia vitripennis]
MSQYTQSVKPSISLSQSQVMDVTDSKRSHGRGHPRSSDPHGSGTRARSRVYSYALGPSRTCLSTCAPTSTTSTSGRPSFRRATATSTFFACCSIRTAASTSTRARFASRSRTTATGTSRTCRLYFDSKIVERFIPDSRAKKEDVKPDCRLKEFDEFELMLENGVFSDARLRAQAVQMRVHRAVLATRSRVFAVMMSPAEKNNGNDFVLVDVPDVRVDVLRELLRFVYAGKVNEIETVAKDLLVAAIRFELEGLKITCEETLLKELCIKNVGEMLAFADKHKTEMLAKSAMEFFTMNAKPAVGTDNFKSAMQSCPFWITAMVNALVQKLD